MPALNTDEFMEGKTVEYVKLANGIEIPKIGYGVFQISKDDAPRCVREAIETGYRHIDTAQSYFNEAEVGQGIKDSGIDRKDLFLTTKIWISNYGYENTLRSVDVSLKKLGTDYLDLVLLHQPFSDTYGAWRALEKLYKDGVIRAIGPKLEKPAEEVLDASHMLCYPGLINTHHHLYPLLVLSRSGEHPSPPLSDLLPQSAAGAEYGAVRLAEDAL